MRDDFRQNDVKWEFHVLISLHALFPVFRQSDRSFLHLRVRITGRGYLGGHAGVRAWPTVSADQGLAVAADKQRRGGRDERGMGSGALHVHPVASGHGPHRGQHAAANGRDRNTRHAGHHFAQHGSRQTGTG